MKALLLHACAGVWLLGSAVAGCGGQFSFPADFLVPPDPGNTSTHVWQYFYNIDMRNRTGTYARLPIYDDSIESSGTAGWRAFFDRPPYIGRHLAADVLFPYVGVGEGHVHPANDRRGVAIGFQAPSNGLYQVSGSVRAAGGGSINWYLDQGGGSNVLASGRRLFSGGYHNFFAPRVSLAKDEFVFLIVDDDGDNFADSTVVEITVKPLAGPLNLDVNLLSLAGLTVSGEPGHTYRVEYIDAVSSTNAWTTLTNVTLSGNSQMVVDPLPLTNGRRFYRAVKIP